MPHRSSTPDDSSDDQHSLEHVIEHLAHLLPAQGPISIFIHHNTLHAFEHLPFEEAVERGADRFDCQPFLSEARYRAKLTAGRILAKDVEFLIGETLAERGDEPISNAGTRFDLWRRIVLHGIPAAHGRTLSWLLEESPALSRFLDPTAFEPPASLQPIQEWVERGDTEADDAVRLRLDEFGNLVAMAPARLDERQDEHFRTTLLQFALEDLIAHICFCDIYHTDVA